MTPAWRGEGVREEGAAGSQRLSRLRPHLSSKGSPQDSQGQKGRLVTGSLGCTGKLKEVTGVPTPTLWPQVNQEDWVTRMI